MMSAGAWREATLRRALLILAPAMTIVVAAEFIVVGLLPAVSQDLHITLAQAGQLSGAWAFAAAVIGPVLTLATSRIAPKPMLIGILLVFAIGNALMAVLTDFGWLLIARVVQGALLPAFISVGAAVVTRLAKPGEQGKGLTRANIGFVLGILITLPAGVAIARGGDWRVPFIVLAVLSLLMAMLTAGFFPVISNDQTPKITTQLRLLQRPDFLANLALSVVFFATMFAAYVYLGAWVKDGLGLSVWPVALVLLLFGVSGLIGNSVAGRIADRGYLRTPVIAALVLAVSVNLAVLLQHCILLAMLPLAIWAILHTLSVTLSQVRVTLAGKVAPAFAMTLNISAANLGIGIGTIGGGWMIDRHGIAALGIAPLGFSSLAIPFAYLVIRLKLSSRVKVPV